MKVCIVTLYKTINSGSFLQAFALKNYLESIGCEVFILKYNYTLKTRIKDLLKYPKNIIFESFDNFKTFVNTNKKFKEMQKNLNLISLSNALKEIDYFVFGSDTIWNIDSENLFKLRKILFGMSFNGKKKIAYAASFANVKYEKVISHVDIVNALNDFDFISVRDIESKKLIEKICHKNTSLVCDPTLLVDKTVYNSLINSVVQDNYIFVYLFSDLDSNLKRDLIEFAHKNNLIIISGTKSYTWCDMRISNSPDSFLSYINSAKYIVTDTFHGTIFSTIFGKNYVVINRNKNKVNDFLNRCKLDSRLINSNDSIGDLFRKKIDYVAVNKIIADYKKESIDYISESFDNISNRS